MSDFSELFTSLGAEEISKLLMTGYKKTALIQDFNF